MTCKIKALVVGAAVMLLLVGSIAGWATAIIRDGDPFTIGAVLAQKDGTTARLTAEQIVRRGRSGKSFAIKEWFDKYTTQPRLVVVSSRQLPVGEFWTCDLTGVLSTFSGVSGDGSTIRQRVLIVSPENVSIYTSPNRRPIFFVPIKGFETNWPNKLSLAGLVGASVAASVSTINEGGLPPMPDSLGSITAPVYCATIADARAQYSATSRNLVELQPPVQRCNGDSVYSGTG